jgi:hypothetical protein
MASAPTGDAPAVDEQPRSEEKPEVNGNPLEQGSSSEMPPARPPPRLRLKCRKAVQFHVAKDAPSAELQERPAAVRVLLLNGRWLDAFFDAAHFGAARIFFGLARTTMGKLRRRSFRLVKTATGVAALLRLHRELTEIDVQATNDATGGDSGAMHEWMRVASELRGEPFTPALLLEFFRSFQPFRT